MSRIADIIGYGWFLIVTLLIRPIVRAFGWVYNKYKWNDGLCRRCDGHWFLDAYDSDRIWPERYRCSECSNTLYSTTLGEPLKELKDDEAKAKRRENKLEKLLK